MKRYKIISTLILFTFTIIILTAVGAADNELLFATGAEADAVYEALLGAENTRLALGVYESDTGTTAELSETELQAQIDAYNAQVNQYYAVSSPCYDSYKETHASCLRDSFADMAFYRVEGGVLDYEIHSLSFDDTKTRATVEMNLVSYNNWVVETETHNYTVQCCAGEVELTALMVKEGDMWKFERHEEYHKLDNWIPQDVLNSETAEIGLYSMPEAQQADVMEAANLTSTEYTSFADAIRAASQIQVEEICPFTAG